VKKLLIISPHLSTGGLPQVVCKKIEILRNDFLIKCIEWDFLSGDYVVQRNRIIEMLGDNFHSMGDDKRGDLSRILLDFDPDVVCLEEFPEMYMDDHCTSLIYDKERRWSVTESTHTSTFPPMTKRWLPDRFVFVSEYTRRSYENFGIPIDVIEYPVDKKERNQREAQEKLGLDPDYKHIVTVGLFTRNKNQGFAFDIARLLKDEKIKFHFLGNQAMNFHDYWGPIMERKPDSCTVWGERSDVDTFLQACDAFLFPSVLELNPLCVKEAMEYSLPIMLFQLDSYCGKYENIEGIHSLSGNASKDSQNLKSILFGVEEKVEQPPMPLLNSPAIKMVHLLLNPEYQADVPDDSWGSTIDKQQKSIDCFDPIKYKFSGYSQIFSNVNRTELPYDSCAEPSKLYRNEDLKVMPYTLSYGHYGAYVAHRRGITQEFSDECDCLLILEGDAFTNLDSNEFYDKVLEAYKLGIEKNASLISLAGLYFLTGEDYWSQVEDVEGYPDFVKVPHFMMGTAYLVFKKERETIKNKFETRGWHSPDIWLAWNHNKQGDVYASRDYIAYQASGYSLLDFHEKDDQASYTPDKKKGITIKGPEDRSRIAVLVINLNNLQFTKDCIFDLSKQDIEFDLCLIDQNSSENGTSEYLDSLLNDYNKKESLFSKTSIKNLEIIRNEKNESLNYLWNLFAAGYKNEFLCILNNDVRVCPNFLSSSLEVFEKEPNVGFVNHVSNNLEYTKWSKNLDYRVIDHPYRQGWDFTFRREAYHQIPDSLKFFYGDDYIYSKLYSSGMKGAYVLNSPMLHYERSTTVEKGGQRDASPDGASFHQMDLEYKNMSFIEDFSKWKPQFLELSESEPVERKRDTASIDLSILVCSLIERRNQFLDRLLESLERQVGSRRNIEILVVSDNARRKIGGKRNDAISIARGEYVCFIDDDDMVSDDYVDSILREITVWRPDVVVFNATITFDGERPKLVRYGMEYDYCERDDAYYRHPNHLMVHKRENINEIFMDVRTGEDDEWAARMLPKIKSQRRIDRVLYYYDYRTTTKKYFTDPEVVKINDQIKDRCFITHSDKKYLPVVENLARSLSIFSKYKLIVYCLECKQEDVLELSRFENVEIRHLKVDILKENSNNLNFSPEGNFYVNRGSRRTYEILSSKVWAMESALLEGWKEISYLDSDCLATPLVDEIFNWSDRLTDYPLGTEGIHNYMLIIKDGKQIGNPFENSWPVPDNKLCLEWQLMEMRGMDPERRGNYRTTGIMLMNQSCLPFIARWKSLCKEIAENFDDPQNIAPFHEESIFNVLLWEVGNDGLPLCYINVSEGADTIKKFYSEEFEAGTRSWDEEIHENRFFVIPEDKRHVKVFHGEKRRAETDKIIDYILNYSEEISI
jgi:hypothetical protein